MHLVQGGTKTHLLGSRLPRQAVLFAHRRGDRDLLRSDAREGREGSAKTNGKRRNTEKTSRTYRDVDAVVKGLLDLLTDLVVLEECTTKSVSLRSDEVKKAVHRERFPAQEETTYRDLDVVLLATVSSEEVEEAVVDCAVCF